METDEGYIHPPSWIPSSSNNVAVVPSVPNLRPPPSSSRAVSPEPFNMDDYRKCRQAEALRWIDLQEKRASVIARLQPVLPEEYKALRNAVIAQSKPFSRTVKKRSGMVHVLSIIKIPLDAHLAPTAKQTLQKEKAPKDHNHPNIPTNPYDLLNRRLYYYYFVYAHMLNYNFRVKTQAT